jgi:hypothetical protein
MLVYKLSGLPMMISDEMVEKYKKELSQKILQLKLRSMKSTITYGNINQTESDLENKILLIIREYPTSAGIVLKVL